MIIEPLGGTWTEAERAGLARVLAECVAGGASIGFMLPVDAAEIADYWAKIEADLASGWRVLLVARETAGGEIVGTVQLAAESRRNGRHRAEVQKLMVRPGARGQGLGRELMGAAEAMAAARGLTLLFLDTSEGAAGAGGLYDALGYVRAGGIPGWALNPDGLPAANVIYYKTLAPGG
jgi:ribosomal protein S18 acetylase RimI-like enzyme